MAYTADRLKEGFLKSLENAMTIERKAVHMHLQNIDLMIPVLRDYDKKVINKRLYDALNDATIDRGVYTEKLSYGTVITSTYQDALQVGEKWQYAEYYRTRSFQIVPLPTDGRRLDAVATIDRMQESKELLSEYYEMLQFDSKLATERYERLKAIETSIDQLLDACDPLTKHALRSRSSKIY